MRLSTRPLSEQVEEKQRGINIVDLMMWLVIAALMLAAAIQSIGYYQKAAYLYQMNTEAEVVAGKVNAAASIDGSSVDLTLIKKIVDEENLAHPDSPMKLTYGSVSAYAAPAPSSVDNVYGFERSSATTETTTGSQVNYLKATHTSVPDREVVFLFNATSNYKAGVNVIDTGSPAFSDPVTTNSPTTPPPTTTTSPTASPTSTAVSPSPTPTATSTATTPAPTPTPTATVIPAPTTVNWTSKTTSFTTNIYRAKGSSDLSRLFGGGSGTIRTYLSVDGGTSWRQGTTDNSNVNHGQAISRDGMKMITGCNVSGSCYMSMSNDGGNTWVTNKGAGAGVWEDFTISDDGTKIIASDNSAYGGLWVSTDGGTTWAKKSSSGATSVASTPDGKNIWGVSNAGIKFSTDYGSTWAMKSGVITSGSFGTSVAVSPDGKYVTVGTNGSNAGVYTSSDSGATWKFRALGTATTANITGVSVSDDGSRQVAADYYNGAVWFSLDSGVTWQKATLPNSNWRSALIAADGSKLVVTSLVGGVYIGIPS